MKRKEIKAIGVKQDNETKCFGCGNDLNRSAHAQKAKRLASKRVRRHLKRDTYETVLEKFV